MARNRIDANVRCPSCSGPLFPRVLVCETCRLRIEGDFVMNEFGSLTPDELHFLRVFIFCEGRIKDMEAALGVSYPTVKAHLASIKRKLNLSKERAPSSLLAGGQTGQGQEGTASADDVLDRLETGQLSYKEALRMLRAVKKGGKADGQASG